MHILINCSNLKTGGGLQVAHSFIHGLSAFSEHHYTIVLSAELNRLLNNQTSFPPNFRFYTYNVLSSLTNAIVGKNTFLNDLVHKSNITVVFSVFGPTYWKPNVRHICGYARPQYIDTQSPYFSQISLFEKIKWKLSAIVHLHAFRTQCDELFSENVYVSNALMRIFPNKKIYTVTNYYHQVFDQPNEWDISLKLPAFSGTTLLTVAVNYPHKNLKIIPKVISYLKKTKPDFRFRFVLTLDEGELSISEDVGECIVFVGKVNINQCPYLYEQSDFMFLPTLLETFSASYAEAMKMEKPILTSDLDFAHGLCGEAAVYFDPTSPEDIGEKIYFLANSVEKQKDLTEKGKRQLLCFDNYNNRTIKFLDIITHQ